MTLERSYTPSMQHLDGGDPQRGVRPELAGRGTVSDISRQTRLVAPNAGVDAAPAGMVWAALLASLQTCRTLPREQELPRLSLRFR